jgi:anti-sigma-K factor RskA
MNEHERVQELAAEFALDVLDPADYPDVVQHLAGCAECRRVYRETRAVGGALARSVPPVATPPELRARILAGATSRPQPIVSGRQPVVSRRQWGGWAVGVAAAAIAVAAGVDDARQRQGLAAAKTDLAAAEGQLAVQRAIAQPVLDGQRFVRLAPVSGAGPAAIWVNPPGKSPYLAAPNLPKLQPDRTYELWFLQGSKALPAGVFQAGTVLALPALPIGTTALAVTVEPGGGSPTPTSSPILVGTV